MFAKSNFKPTIFCILVNLLITISTFSQTTKLDSLQRALKNAKHDTTRLHLRYEIGEVGSIYRIGYWDSLSSDSKKFKVKIIEANSINNMGFIYHAEGDIPNALSNFKVSLKIQEEIGDKKGIAQSLNNIAAIYKDQGDIPVALDYYDRSLKIREEIGDKNGIAQSLINIGVIYQHQGDVPNALIYFGKSLKLYEEIGDTKGVTYSLNNIGTIYDDHGELAKALKYYNECLKIQKEIGDKKGIGISLHNIGLIYFKQGDNQKALDYYKRSLEIKLKLGDKKGIAFSQHNIGSVYITLGSTASSSTDKKKNYLLAYSYTDSSLVLSKQLGYPINIRNAERTLSKIDSARGNFKEAFDHYKWYVFYNDSINNETTRKASVKSQLKYEYEKKEAVLNEQQEKERAVTEEKSRFQQIIIWSVAIGFLLVLVFATFVFRALKTTRLQKIIIEEKQREILGSIRYAKRIQKSLLPTETYIDRNLKRLNK